MATVDVRARVENTRDFVSSLPFGVLHMINELCQKIENWKCVCIAADIRRELPG